MFTGLFYLPTLLSSGLACFVEMVEALTIVLAVAAVRGWRTAWAGSAAALAVLALIVIVGGPALRHVDLQPLRIIIGGLVLLFGMRWLRKSILRSAGRIALHDEASAFRNEVKALESTSERRRYGIDVAAMMTAFNGVLIEGIEVVFIVVAVGSTARRLDSAAAGAVAALIAVVVLGAALRRPLSKIPENTLKLLVGVMLTGLGTLWTGEGIGLQWPFGDWAVAAIVAAYFIAALSLTSILRTRRQRAVEVP